MSNKKEELIVKLLALLKKEKDDVNQCLIDGTYDLITKKQRIAFCTGKALQKLLKLK